MHAQQHAQGQVLTLARPAIIETWPVAGVPEFGQTWIAVHCRASEFRANMRADTTHQRQQADSWN